MNKIRICKTCKREVAKKIKKCPYCGTVEGVRWGLSFGIAFLLLTMLFVSVVNKNDNAEKNNNNKNNNVNISSNEEPTIVSEKEILFRDAPWGISFTKAKEKFGTLGLWGMHGENFKTFSVDDITLGDYKGIDFEFGDINIIGNCDNDKIEVAGYTTTEVQLYFAYLPKDGVLKKSENESALYGGRYKFEPQNVNEMYSDLISKLTQTYGDYSKQYEETDLWKNVSKYTVWYGQNDTMLVLKSVDTSNSTTDLFIDEIYISYVWTKGDDLLQNASDTLKKEAGAKESAAAGNNSTNGL